MKLSVIICTIPDRQNYLLSLLSDLAEQSYLPDEVIIVVDQSCNLTISFSNLPFNLRVIETNGKGLSKARNKGVTLSMGDIILFIDDDVILSDTNILFNVKAAFEENQKLGIYGVQVKPLFFNSIKLPDKFNWIYGCTDDKAVRPVGAFFAVRRECFNVVGLFSEALGRFGNYLLSGEETEFINRVRKYMGLEIMMDNSLNVNHIVFNRDWKYIIKRVFMEGYSKSKFRNYDTSVECMYISRYLNSSQGLIVTFIACVGYIFGKLENIFRRWGKC